MPKGLTGLWQFLRFVARRFDEDRCMQIASSLTYTTLLALVPFASRARAQLASPNRAVAKPATFRNPFAGRQPAARGRRSMSTPRLMIA